MIKSNDSNIENVTMTSSVITGAKYEKANNKMTITFNSGKEYEYIITGELWSQFKDAPSKGKFFNSEIKGRFKPEIV